MCSSSGGIPETCTSRQYISSGASIDNQLQISGDAWDCYASGDTAALIVCDGLGHGDGAADAARAVIAAFRERPGDAPAAILQRADRAAKSTRGAAATVVRIDLAAREAVIAGVGNVSVWIVAGAQRQVVTQHGTLGHATPRLREERHAFPPGARLLLASDGLKSRIDLAAYPDLIARDPLAAAAVLWRDFARGRDDATVVVAAERT